VVAQRFTDDELMQLLLTSIQHGKLRYFDIVGSAQEGDIAVRERGRVVRDLTPVPSLRSAAQSAKRDGCLLAKVNALPLAATPALQ